MLETDFSGRVKAVSAPDSELFDFPARNLVGASLCDFIDVFSEWQERTGDSQLQLLLLALLDKEHELPGMWLGATQDKRHAYDCQTAAGGLWWAVMHKDRLGHCQSPLLQKIVLPQHPSAVSAPVRRHVVAREAACSTGCRLRSQRRAPLARRSGGNSGRGARPRGYSQDSVHAGRLLSFQQLCRRTSIRVLVVGIDVCQQVCL